MPEPVRRLLIVARPAPWFPRTGQRVAQGLLTVEQAPSLQGLEAPAPDREWDVVAFRAQDLRPLGPAEVLAALRHLAPQATYLPVTAAPDPQEALYYLKHGAFEYLTEPLPPEEFLRALGEAIENRETFREILDLNRALEAQKEQLLSEKAILERKNRELEAVSRLAQALAATLDPGEIAAQLARNVQEALGFPRVLVGLVDHSGKWEEVREELGPADPAGTARGTRWMLRDARVQPWIRTVLQRGEVLRADAPADHPDVRDSCLGRLHRHPFVKVPLVAGGAVLGTVTAETGGPGEPISEEALAVLHIFADTAAVALANARLYEAMKELSVRDELTGLFNRRHLLSRLEAECVDADRHKSPLSVLLLDLDHFKLLNDGNDHLTGDAALRRLAGLLLKNTRGIDTVARYGGEEFVILLPRTAREKGRFVAEKLRRVVEAAAFEGAQALPGGRLTASVGVSCCPDDATGPMELLERADWALYQAKSAGRNRVCVWEADAGRPRSAAGGRQTAQPQNS